jgi:hypothetical protein
MADQMPPPLDSINDKSQGSKGETIFLKKERTSIGCHKRQLKSIEKLQLQTQFPRRGGETKATR